MALSSQTKDQRTRMDIHFNRPTNTEHLVLGVAEHAAATGPDGRSQPCLPVVLAKPVNQPRKHAMGPHVQGEISDRLIGGASGPKAAGLVTSFFGARLRRTRADLTVDAPLRRRRPVAEVAQCGWKHRQQSIHSGFQASCPPLGYYWLYPLLTIAPLATNPMSAEILNNTLID